MASQTQDCQRSRNKHGQAPKCWLKKKGSPSPLIRTRSPEFHQKGNATLYQWFHSSPCQGGGDEELHRILPSVAFHKKNAQVSNMVMDRCSHDLTCPHEQKCILNLWGDQHVKRQSQLCGEIGKFGTAFFQGRHGSAGGIKVSWDPFFFTFKGSRHDWRIIGAASWMLRMMPILRCWRIFDVTCQLRKGNDEILDGWSWSAFEPYAQWYVITYQLVSALFPIQKAFRGETLHSHNPRIHRIRTRSTTQLHLPLLFSLATGKSCCCAHSIHTQTISLRFTQEQQSPTPSMASSLPTVFLMETW